MYGSRGRREILREARREDEPQCGHVSRHRSTHHGLMRVHSKVPCRRPVRRSRRSERALAPREIARLSAEKNPWLTQTVLTRTTTLRQRLLALFHCQPELAADWDTLVRPRPARARQSSTPCGDLRL